jgi:hypothetical protein
VRRGQILPGCGRREILPYDLMEVSVPVGDFLTTIEESAMHTILDAHQRVSTNAAINLWPVPNCRGLANLLSRYPAKSHPFFCILCRVS